MVIYAEYCIQNSDKIGDMYTCLLGLNFVWMTIVPLALLFL
jgi:hypothetical protein